MLKLLIKLAYQFWPSLYKKRYYKTLDSLATGNYKCEPELLYIQQILKPDSVFIDIGTNKGIYLYQAEKVIKTGKVIGLNRTKVWSITSNRYFQKRKFIRWRYLLNPEPQC